MKKTLHIVVVTYNSQFWVKKALDSIIAFAKDLKNFTTKVSVVDNFSEDDTTKMIEKEYSWVNLIRLNQNLGFAYANNQAIKQVAADYTMLLNSDAELTANSHLHKLLKFMEDHPQVGMVTPRIEFISGQLDIACHRGEPTPFASFCYFFGLQKLFPTSPLFARYHQTFKDLNSLHLIDACSGAAMVVRAEAVEKVGLLDEQFFMYAEDLDWCRRFRENGYQIIYYPESVVIHHKNKSGIKSSSQKLAIKTKFHFYDTMLQYFDKYYGKRYPRFVRTVIKYYLVIKKGAL